MRKEGKNIVNGSQTRSSSGCEDSSPSQAYWPLQPCPVDEKAPKMHKPAPAWWSVWPPALRIHLTIICIWIMASANVLSFVFYFSRKISSAISIRGIMDHLHRNNPFLELEQSCVSNSTTCSTNSTVDLLHGGVRGAELEKRERSSPKHPLKKISTKGVFRS
jgi:hypothetical protein